MAQTGYTPILIYASGTTGNTPSASNLTSSSAGAELALNYFDGKLFYKDASGNVQVLAGKGGTGVVAGSNTQVQFNNNGVFGASSGLTWDGTNLTASQLRSSGLTSGRVTYASTSGLLVDSANMTFNGTRLTVADLADSGLTPTRVVYSTTGGALTDSANLTFSGTLLNVTGNLSLSAGSATVGGYQEISFPAGVYAKAAIRGYSVSTTDAGELRFYTAPTSDVIQERLRVTSGGNVLVATTVDAGVPIVYGGTATIRNINSAQGGIETNNSAGTASIAGFAMRYIQNVGSGYHAWDTSGSLSQGAAVSYTEQMRLTTTGLGIGTSSPSSKLQVVSGAGDGLSVSSNVIPASFSATNGSFLLREFGGSAANNTLEINIRPNSGRSGYLTFVESAVADRWAIGTQNGSGNLRFIAGTPMTGSLRATLTSAGIWGINTTPNAWDANIGLMDFRGNGGLSSDSNYFYVSNNIYYDGSNNRRKSANPVSLLALGGTSNVPLVLSYGATGAADSVIAFSEAFRVNSSGQFLVGGTSAVGRLGVWGDIAKITTTGVDSTFDNVIKYGTAADLGSGTALANRWIGFDASITANAGVFNVLRARVYPGTAGNAAPVNVVDFRGDQSTLLYGSLLTGGTTGAPGMSSGSISMPRVTGRKVDLYEDSNTHMGLGVDVGGGSYELSAYFPAGNVNQGSFRIGVISHANPGTWSERARFPATGGIYVGTTGMVGGGAFQFRSDGEKFNIFSDNSSFGQLQMGSVTSGEVSMSFIPKTVSFGTNPTSSDGDNACWAFGYGTAGFGGMGFYNKGNGANVCTITRTSTSWAFASDARLKDIDGSIENALSKIDALRPVYFTWKNDSEKRRKVGLIAQDVLTVLPEAVEVPEKEIDDQGRQQYLSMSMPDIVPLLVAAIQELKAEFAAYKATHP